MATSAHNHHILHPMDLDTYPRSEVQGVMMSRRSVSPISPTRSEGDQRPGLLSYMSRRLGRKTSQEYRIEYHPEDDSGCSTDSGSSAGANSSSSNYSSSNLTSNDDTSNMELASDYSCSSKSLKHSKSSVHFRSTSSLRKALRSLSISTRSLSCTRERRAPDPEDRNEYEKRVSFKTIDDEEDVPNKHEQRAKSSHQNLISQRSKTPPPQRRILRQPVSYLYMKGISGLPTQRVPRSSVCCPQGYR